MAGNSLVFFSPGAQTWQQISLPEAQRGLTLGIGRGSENWLSINDPRLSTNHALLLVDPQGIYILDQNSSNGVLLNQQLIPPNQWMLLTPGSTLVMGQTTLILEMIETPPALSSPIAPPLNFQSPEIAAAFTPKKRVSPVPFIVGGFVLLLIVSGAILLISRLGVITALPVTGSDVNAAQHSLTVNADGQTQTDANGISITLPVDALMEGAAQLTSATLPDELTQELEEGYKILTPAYSLTGQGAVDGALPGLLSFPAEDDDVRLMAVIDGMYAAELKIKPENGVIALPADIHPADSGDLAGTDPMWQSGSIQYMLVRPTAQPQSSQTSLKKLAAPARQTTGIYSCVSLTRTFCWQNGNGSVQLFTDWDNRLTPAQTEAVINYIQTTMEQYEGAGFANAIFTASIPIQVVITAGNDAPQYLLANGVIYLPRDVATQIAAGGKDHFLIHEMAHWIQDKAYYMYYAYSSGSGTWWIEASAENMEMIIDPDYVSKNIEIYGSIDVDESSSVMQYSPYQWPTDESYVMAQQVKLNMCDSDACPISEKTFKIIIDRGWFPFDEASSREKLHANLTDYARYLLGVLPQNANTDIRLEGVKTGEFYGDTININGNAQTGFIMRGRNARVIPDDKNGFPGASVTTTIQKDGIYALRVIIGEGDMAPNWPAMLRIEPGAPFYYRLNDGDVQFSDGKNELIIQPLMQGSTGKEITKVRIIAVGQQGGEVFKARIGAADLSGMWMIIAPDDSLWINNLTCQDASEKESVARLAVFEPNLAIMFGDFVTDPDKQTLIWKPNPERVSEILGNLGATNSTGGIPSSFTAEAVVSLDGVDLTLSAFVPEKTTFVVDPTAYKSYFITVPGTYGVKGIFNQITFVGTETANTATGVPTLLAWKLSGANLIYTLDVDLLNQEVNPSAVLESETRVHCTGTIEIPGDVEIYQPSK